MPVVPHAVGSGPLPAATLRVGLVNNMPDAALARTERQFIDMLAAAMPDREISLSFYSIAGLPRGEMGQAHLSKQGYRSIAQLMGDELDALIVTGTEPKCPNLRDEPYWANLAALFDWIAMSGPSTIFSCLAAHAAVLHFDGIERQRLADKRCGLFAHKVVRKHPLVAGLSDGVRVAHSRWNEVRRTDLEARGYEVLTEAPDAGVDLFMKPGRNPLLFFQGHPEYDSGTLFREYRRDIQRFLAGTNDNYPAAPRDYFSGAETALLDDYRHRALTERDEALLDFFPVARRSEDASTSPMASVYRAWLLRIANEKDAEQTAPAPRFGGMQR